MPNSFSPLMVFRICERSITWPPEAVVSGAVGRGHVPQPKRVRGRDGDGGRGLTAPGEDVQDHIRRVDTGRAARRVWPRNSGGGYPGAPRRNQRIPARKSTSNCGTFVRF